MNEYEIVGVLETERDYERLLRTWKDQPKHCKCGAVLSKGRHKCDKCIPKQDRREYYKKRRKAGH